MMKQGHFAVIFLVIFVTAYLGLTAEQCRYDHVLYEKNRIEKALTAAMDIAGKEYAGLIYESEKERQDGFRKEFFEALYISMGALEDKEMQERLKLHLPLLVIVEEEGMYFCYMEEKNTGERVELQHVWTEKIIFTDLAEVLENRASEYITMHNYIASQYGITYSFSVPDFLKGNVEEMNYPMLFVVFQGWPLNATGDIIYENCLDAGGYLKEKEYFVVTFPKNLADTKSKYHRRHCSELEYDSMKISERVLSKEEAVRQYGAFPCEKCFPYVE